MEVVEMMKKVVVVMVAVETIVLVAKVIKVK